MGSDTIIWILKYIMKKGINVCSVANILQKMMIMMVMINRWIDTKISVLPIYITIIPALYYYSFFN